MLCKMLLTIQFERIALFCQILSVCSDFAFFMSLSSFLKTLFDCNMVISF